MANASITLTTINRWRSQGFAPRAQCQLIAVPLSHCGLLVFLDADGNKIADADGTVLALGNRLSRDRLLNLLRSQVPHQQTPLCWLFNDD